MGSGSNPIITFLSWAPVKQSEKEQCEQRFRRHQHAALFTHRRKKINSRLLQHNEAQTRISPPTIDRRPSNKDTGRTRSKRGTVVNEDERTAVVLRAFPSADSIDPFEACCVLEISSCAQMMLQFGMPVTDTVWSLD